MKDSIPQKKVKKPSLIKDTQPDRKKKTIQPKSPIDGLRKLFLDGLKDIYWAENALTKVLPKMAGNTDSKKLVHALNDHLLVTETQADRLQQVFDVIRKRAVAKKCEAMAGLIKEANGIIEETETGPVRDAGIIAAFQKITHYKIATYGTLTAFAKTLGEEFAATLLHETLKEEKEVDLVLTEVAAVSINFSLRKISAE